MTSRLSLQGIEKSWGTRRLLEGIDLDVDDGEVVAVLGPSGCGKTTLLRIAAGLDRPDAGRVVVDGVDVTAERPAARGVGMVFQHSALIPHLTVADNIGFGRRRGTRRGRPDAEEVLAVARATGCDELLRRLPATLSAGERQRVAIARALVRRPRIVLLDEPLSSLDPPVRVALRTELASLFRATGTAAVFVSHDHAEAFAMGSRVVVLAAGRVQQDGTPDEIHDGPATLEVVDVLGPTRFNTLPCAMSPSGVLRAGPFRVDRPPPHLPHHVIAVVRPSDVCLPDEGRPDQAAGTVVAVEPSDERVLVTVSADDVVLRVLVARDRRPAVGDRVTVDADSERFAYYDAGDGRRVGGPE